MADLIFADSHNMVAYLEKSEDSADFVEIVDFLNASPIRYALTTIVITESSVRRDLYFDDEDGITYLTNTEIFENLQLMGSKSTAWNEFGTNIASAVICLAKKQKFNFSKLIFDGKEKNFQQLSLFATILIQSQAVEGEGSGQPSEPQHTPTTASPSHVEPIPIVASSSQPKKTHKHMKPKRKATEISQSSGPPTLVADDIIHEKRGDSMEWATTTATSLDAEQGSGNINKTQSMTIPNDPFPQGIGSGGSPRRQDIMGDRPAQTRFERLSKQSNDLPLSRVNTLVSGEDNIKLQELMDLCTKLSDKVLDLENVKNAQALEIQKLKKRVKKLEQTQGRYGHDIGVNTASTSITTASINITTVEPVTTASAPITTVGVSVSTAEPRPHYYSNPYEDEE
ncbi:hypothetical protein Tco_0071562 [Tanacetum coccineum]